MIPLNLSLSRDVDARYKLEFHTVHAGKNYGLSRIHNAGTQLTHILSLEI